jgi:energy-coupling factor transporter ATP-binding protein EcfA2
VTDPRYPYLNLADWPFQLVASASTADVWVGRPDFLRELRALERTVSRVQASQIVLLWASFGSGKTHALLHLAGLAAKHDDLVPLYVVTPKGIRSFIDIYRAIADSALESGAASFAGRALFERSGGSAESDVDRALLRIGVYGDEDANTAAAWLRAENVPMKDLRQIGIGARLQTTADAISALSRLVPRLQQNGEKKLVLLLDEVQELEELGKRLDECVGGLRKVFDQNTNGLTMVLSFTTAMQSSLRGILGDALFDRVSATLTLPPLRPDEAADFVTGLLKAWSIDPARAPFPFTPEAIKAVVRELVERRMALTPRTVIKTFNQLLRRAEGDIEDGLIEAIDTAFAVESLADDVT